MLYVLVSRSVSYFGYREMLQRFQDLKMGNGKGEVRTKNPSVTLNLGTNGLKVTSEPPPMAGLLARIGSLSGHPSSSHARRCLIWLSCDNHCTRYTAPISKGLCSAK
ncbi:hypothetical protein J6590_042118 [Homalodisca vitripennis]|nr:hypothetical protein J6590_042118 [Homalodisca vitripennis]